MSGDHLDRREPLPTNHVFEAHNDDDPTSTWFLHVFEVENGKGVHLNIVEDIGEPGSLTVKHMQRLSLAQCHDFGEALLAVCTQAHFAA